MFSDYIVDSKNRTVSLARERRTLSNNLDLFGDYSTTLITVGWDIDDGEFSLKYDLEENYK